MKSRSASFDMAVVANWLLAWYCVDDLCGRIQVSSHNDPSMTGLVTSRGELTACDSSDGDVKIFRR